MRFCRAFSAFVQKASWHFWILVADRMRCHDGPAGPLSLNSGGSIMHMIKFARALLLGTVATYPAIAGQALGEAIRQNPECRQFNDGCSICQMVDGQAICSTPGIACITTEWYCLEGEQGADGLGTRSTISGMEE